MLDELSDHLVDEMLAETHRHLQRGASAIEAFSQGYAYIERKLENALDIAHERTHILLADEGYSI